MLHVQNQILPYCLLFSYFKFNLFLKSRITIIQQGNTIYKNKFSLYLYKAQQTTMEKLRSLRKQRGYTQEYMSKILSTDVSNYSRKESGDVKIFEDEWEKLAKALEVPVEEIKEERSARVVNNDNLVFNDQSANNNFNQYYNIPEYILENQQEYINLLKEQIEALKEENKRLKSGK